MSKESYSSVGGTLRKNVKKYYVKDGITREIARGYAINDGLTRMFYQNVVDIASAVVTLGAALTYNGSVQTKKVASVVLDGKTLVEGTDYTVSGNTGTNAGSYTLTITGIGDYEGTVTKPWSIAVLKLAKPTVSGSFTYNGSAQSCTISNMNATYITQSGTTSATNAGTYTVTFTLKSTSNTQWSDGTTAAVSRTWSIGKATGSISVSPTTVDILGPAGTTSTATITYTGDGAISVSSNKTSVATVSRSGKTVTVKSVASGSATITITMAAGTNYTGKSCTISATVRVPSSTLNNNDWATIKSIAASSNGANYWSVGDCKAVTINGTVGAYTFSNETCYCYILGFDHNESIEGKGIHFQFGKTAATGGVDIAFCDSSYASTGSSAAFRMNTTGTNSGGWSGSYMNKTICPAFLSALPSALQSAISACTKYSNNTGGGSNTASYVTSSSSKVWLLAEFEVFGTRKSANSAEQNYQKQYAYYANGNSKIKYKSNGTSTACYWWLRSANSSYSSNFCYVTTSGSVGTPDANYSVGFAPCFKVA